jgi:hypothetical protein
MHRHRDPIQRGLAEKKSGSAACQGVCVFSAGAMKRIVSSRRQLARVCVISAGAMKRIVSSRRRLARVCVISASATKRFLLRCPPSAAIVCGGV